MAAVMGHGKTQEEPTQTYRLTWRAADGEPAVFACTVDHVLEDGEPSLEYYNVAVGGYRKKARESMRRGVKCLFLEVTLDHGRPDRSFVNLGTLEYASGCQLLKDMARGQQGTTALLQAGVCFVRRMFPQVRTLTLSDKSTQRCEPLAYNSSSRDVMSMADYNMFVYGRTWYQRALPGLRPQGERYARVLRNMRRAVKGAIRARVPSFDAWMAGLRTPVQSRETFQWIRHPDVVAALRAAWDGAGVEGTWRDLFRSLHTSNRALSCTLVHDFGTQLATLMAGSTADFWLYKSAWEMPMQAVDGDTQRLLDIERADGFDGENFTDRRPVFPAVNRL